MNGADDLRKAISSLLLLTQDEDILRRILQLLAAGAGGSKKKPGQPLVKHKRINNNTVQLEPEHFQAILALRARFGNAPAARLLGFAPQSITGVVRSEGRVYPPTRTLLVEAISKLSPEDIAPVEQAAPAAPAEVRQAPASSLVDVRELAELLLGAARSRGIAIANLAGDIGIEHADLASILGGKTVAAPTMKSALEWAIAD